ncbi:MAG TPA: nicotinate-nucleotide adenylyltransferase [Chloroflexia bacterium]|nr:nicotinate-nucleotide adenylyltransferase [Chloroflexia bacterium]
MPAHAPARRIGIMGGSFDPIHLAHLIMAESVLEVLSLDLVLFVPAGSQPLKSDKHVSPAQHRIAMVELAIAGNPHFALSRVDVDRPGPSYTVDTVAALRQEWRGPGVEMWFIVGADSLSTFPRWRGPLGILAHVRLAVVRRLGVELDMLSLRAALPQLEERLDWVDAPLIDISGTDIRRRVAAGLSIKYRVPDVVRDYIEANSLYKS